ncbi:hypothetical protein ACOLXF_002170 [Vibrio fluvialis]|nr:hypothetical protein [Vibrio fluvialis]
MQAAINTCLTLLLLLSVFLSASSHAEDDTLCPIGFQRTFQWKYTEFGVYPKEGFCSSLDNCRYRFNTSTCDDGNVLCSGIGFGDGFYCGDDNSLPTCDDNNNCEAPTPDPTPDPDPTDPDPGDDWEAPITYDGWVCYTTAEGDYRCQGGVSMLDYREQFTKLYDQNSYNLYRILDNSSDIAKLSSNVSNVQTSVESVYGTANETLVETREITKKVDALKDELTNLDVDLSDLDPKFAELQSSLSGLNGMSNYYFNAIMGYVAGIPGYYSSLDTNLAAARNDVYSVKTEMQNQFATQNAALTANQQALGDSLATLSGEVSGLADGLEALSSQISAGSGTGSDDVDLSGIESRLKGIQDTLNGVGLSGRAFEGQVDFEGNGLYGSDAIDKLQGEIEQLQEQYQEQMGQFKSLFTFDESQLNAGEYVKHEWTFTFANGRTNSFSSGVFPALLQNANFIAAVLLFLAVLLGIKALTD